MQRKKSYDKLDDKGKLYLVPTPIGNLEDMTFRAVRILQEVSLIASEDTRNTQKLLNHFQINTHQISFHEHNYKERIPMLLKKMEEGESVAQVSDAGMPSISDPGNELVIEAIKADVAVVALPGPTASLTALIASGLSAKYFSFYGFLPKKKKEREDVLDKLKGKVETIIFYESPHRLKSTFQSLALIYGENRKAVLCRELSKIHEEFIRGTLLELREYTKINTIKGECCILVAGNDEESTELIENWQDFSIIEHVNKIIYEENISSNEAIKQVAKIRNLRKQEVYKEYHLGT